MLRETTIETGRVRGIAAANPRITVFRGIPFAAPPVGDLRWRAPQPAKSWEGVRKCDTFGSPSMQEAPGEDDTGFYTKEWYVKPDEPMSEDCLYLNVWTPAKSADEKLPVMVWIFGGGMCFGYTSEMEFDGERIAQRGVVFVSVNYRLSSFGFLAHPELTEEGRAHGECGTNFGLMDQRAGLRWVKKNIAAFGGDPDNVTLFGQSAGGRCTWMHIASPWDRGLFQKAIVQSGGLGGGITRYPDIKQAESAGEKFLSYLGVSTIDEARKIPAEELLAKTLSYKDTRWGPVIDGSYLPMSPFKAITTDQANPVKLMLGSTLDDPDGFRMKGDCAMFLERAKKMYGDDYDEFARLAHLDSQARLEAYYKEPAFSIFEQGNTYAAQQYLEHGHDGVYLYRFNPDIPGDDAGAFHSSDLWFVFETLGKCWRPFKGWHYDLARMMCNYWTNFAKSGNPNGPDNDGAPMPQWLPVDESGYHVQQLGNIVRSIPDTSDALMSFELRRLKRQADMEKIGENA